MRLFAALPLMLSLAACGGRPAPPLPELPAPKSGTFLPEVRGQIDAAHTRAAANPGDAEAVGQYGMVLEAYLQHDAARACYRRAHQLDPRSFQWAYHRARLEKLGTDRAAAVAAMRQALALRPDYLPARLELASMLLASGAAPESRALAEAAVKDAPSSAPAHYALGRAMAALGDHAAASAHLQDAARIAPGYAAAHYALALAYRDLGRTAEGERHMELYQKHRTADPPREDPLVEEVQRLHAGTIARVRRAEQLDNQGRFPEAADEYERALNRGGDDASIHAALVATYSRMAAWDKADAHYRAALALDPACSDAHHNFALLNVARGDYPAAVNAFQKALDADPLDPDTHTKLARVYEMTNQPDKAVRHYRLALEHDPSANQTRALLVNRLLADGRGREALDEMLRLLVAGDVPLPQAQATVRRMYPRVGSPVQVTGYLRDARRRAEAGGRADLVAAIDAELDALRSLAR